MDKLVKKFNSILEAMWCLDQPKQEFCRFDSFVLLIYCSKTYNWRWMVRWLGREKFVSDPR